MLCSCIITIALELLLGFVVQRLSALTAYYVYLSIVLWRVYLIGVLRIIFYHRTSEQRYSIRRL